MPLLSPQLLPIDSINPGTQWSLHQDIPTEPDPDLIDSINNLGLLRPPIVKAHQKDYQLICGARRLRVLRRLGQSFPIACSVVKRDISHVDLLSLVAEDQIQTGPLSPIEAARFIALCNIWCEEPDQQMLSRVASITSTTQRSRLLSLLELEKPIRTSIHRGHISNKTGLSMAQMSSTERTFVHDLFIKLSLNGNKQRRFLELVQIVTGARGWTIERVITDHFAELCSSTIDNVPQQTNALMKRLYELSHPESSVAEETFLRQVAEKNLSANCRVSPSPSFETDKVTLEIEFGNFDAFSKAWDSIKNFV
ncbi:MAG: ParB N-terminal domain-containing protein [Desulfofustis sp.]|nr:ParB N-terminal domain-containing protein [Desulfofustis sp.]